MQIFLLLIIVSFFFGGLYVNAADVSHYATEIEVLDYNGITKNLQDAIDDVSLGESGANGQIVREACRLCVGPAYFNQEENACDSSANDGYAHWTESGGWTLGFAQTAENALGPGASWYYATGNVCKDSCTQSQCDAITSCENGATGDPHNCCEQIPSGGWNAYDQHCNSRYWPEFDRHIYRTYIAQNPDIYENPFLDTDDGDPGLDWWYPYVSNLCCKE